MTNPNTKPEAAPAPIDAPVAPATDTAAKVAPPAAEHKSKGVEPPKS